MTNQLLSPSELPFQFPDFAKISDEDFLPAVDAGIKEQQREIQELLANPDAPDFVNTIEELEASGQTLRRAVQVFGALYSADGTEPRQELVGTLFAKLTEHSNAMMLNSQLYQRCAAAMENTAQALTCEQDRTGKKWLEEFVAAGAHLPAEVQEELKQLNSQLAVLSTAFTQTQLAGQNEAAVLVTDRSELAGLSEAEIDSLAAAAKENGQSGYLITLELPMIQSITAKLENRALRQRVFEASATRGSAGEHSTGELVLKTVRLRARKAQLLGQKDYASTIIPRRTAPSPEAVEELIAKVVPTAMKQAKREQERLAQYALEHDGLTDFAVWDHAYYASKVRSADYSVDEAELSQYFELDRVLHDGVFFAANQLFGITMEPRQDLVGYRDDVRVWEVKDSDQVSIGLFVGDYYTRTTKQGGAWMTSLRDAADLLEELPVIVNVMNVNRSAPGEPTLLSLDEITTMFHEFGHALHGLLSTTEYPSVAGTSVPTDFVEFPSQFNEMWAMWPDVLTNYAKHHQTGQVLNSDLREKILQAQKFGQGYATVEYLAAVIIDWAWHRLTLEQTEKLTDVTAFEEQVLQDAGIDTAIVPPRYRSTFFKHVFSGSHYAAGYYSYFWAEVLDADAEAWMKENGGLSREAGMKYRNELLACGDSRDPMESYRSFTGRNPNPEHLLQRRGLLG